MLLSQLSFLGMAYKSLESIEASCCGLEEQYILRSWLTNTQFRVKLVAEEQHLDFQFHGLEDDGTESYDERDEGDGDDSDSESSDDSENELSFDQGKLTRGGDVLATNTLMQLDNVAVVTFPQVATVNSPKYIPARVLFHIPLHTGETS